VHKAPSLSDLPARIDQAEEIAPADAPRERRARIWVSRASGFLGALCLLLALLEWAIRPTHLRTVLALLVIAMFAAIIHSYMFEDGG
jgi:hypothetical protein